MERRQPLIRQSIITAGTLEPEKPGAAATAGGCVDAPRESPGYRVFGTFRFLLALMVVLHHALIFAEPDLAFLKPWGLALPAVLTFFVLSGYVIAEANSTFYAGRLGRFLLNRVLRIDPPYYAAVVVSLALHAYLLRDAGRLVEGKSAGEVFAANNVAGNFLVMWVWYGLNSLDLAPNYYFVKYVWTVVVEAKFYLAAALLYFAASWPSPALRKYALAVGLVALNLLHVAGRLRPHRRLFDFEFVPYFTLGLCVYYAV